MPLGQRAPLRAAVLHGWHGAVCHGLCRWHSLFAPRVRCAARPRLFGGCGLLQRQQGCLQHLCQLCDRLKRKRLFHRIVHLIQIGHILLRNQHQRHAFAVCRHAFFLQAANGQHLPVQRNFARHGNVRAHLPAGQAGNQRRCQRDARTGPVLRDGPLWRVDVNVRVFKQLGAVPIFFRVRFRIGDGKLGTLFHHFAQRAGQLQLSRPGRWPRPRRPAG